jgi:outer membrane protein assembly factor BamD (BamD/ComL family)
MFLKARNFFLAASVFVLCSSLLQAAYVFRNGTFVNTNDLAIYSLEEHFNLGISALKSKDWHEAMHQFRIVTINFPDSALGKEALYFLGVSYYQLDDGELANRFFSQYLQENSHPTYFEDAFRYKFAIAEAFRDGARRHLFGYEVLPQWVPDKDLAIGIYDEVINSLPNHELAAKALLAKAALFRERDEFRPCIDTLQVTIRKFPRSEHALNAYVTIAQVYLEQARQEQHHPDILALAEINMKKCLQEFPKGEKGVEFEGLLAEMREIFARALYETGLLYERKGRPKASILYYNTALVEYPQTQVATLCKERITALSEYAQEIGVSLDAGGTQGDT